MTRLRLTVKVEYDAHDALTSYGTEDPDEIAKIDKESLSSDFIAEMIDVAIAEGDGSCEITVEPV